MNAIKRMFYCRWFLDIRPFLTFFDIAHLPSLRLGFTALANDSFVSLVFMSCVVTEY